MPKLKDKHESYEKYTAQRHLQYYEKMDGRPETLIADIWYDIGSRKVEYKVYTDILYKKPFGSKTEVTFKDLDEFVESRCFPRERFNCDEVLEACGLDSYDPYAIIKINRGNCGEDHLYLRYAEDRT